MNAGSGFIYLLSGIYFFAVEDQGTEINFPHGLYIDFCLYCFCW